MNPIRMTALAVGLVLGLLILVFATRDTSRDRMTTHLVGAVAPAVPRRNVVVRAPIQVSKFNVADTWPNPVK